MALATLRIPAAIARLALLVAFFLVPVAPFSVENRLGHSTALHATTNDEDINSSSRRQFLMTSLLSTSAILSPIILTPSQALAETEDLISVYFGCGCFWHVQHEFVEAERQLLGRRGTKRNGDLITARAGYAGGKTDQAKACYHNAANIADYGALGHAEVVQVQIPSSAFPDFVTEYCKLFNDQGYRPDQFQDKGSEYRNLVGIPGGLSSPYAQQMVDASIAAGDKLDFAKGKGNDPDRRGLVFIMDTKDFPFRVAEQYHQFHDGFNFGENYPSSYNNLASELARDGSLEKSDCPNGLLGIGALGL